MRISGRRSTGSPRAPAFPPPASPRRPGLDPTTFNKSKRITPDGRAALALDRSVAKSLAATGTTHRHLRAADRRPRPRVAQAVPLIGFAEAGAGGYFDDGGFPPARAGTRSLSGGQ